MCFVVVVVIFFRLLRFLKCRFSMLVLVVNIEKNYLKFEALKNVLILNEFLIGGFD